MNDKEMKVIKTRLDIKLGAILERYFYLYYMVKNFEVWELKE